MAPAGKAMSTMADGLVALITSIAQMKVAPDADIAFLNDLEAQIATKVRETQAADLASQAGQIAPGAMPAGGGADMLGNITPGMAPGPNPMGAMGMPPMPGGGMPMAGGMPPAAPNTDELRRTLNIG